ncbi:MAG: hypothetical protein ACRBCS_01960 [Cellvibrionaceae bacterium]
MWVFVGIIVLVIALGAGPIMWIRPTPRQKQIASYRQRAAEIGLRVKLVPLKSIGISQELLSVKDGLPFYGVCWDLTNDTEKEFATTLAHGSWCLRKEGYEHEGHFMGVWDWSTERKSTPESYVALREFVAALPDDVIACECTGQGVGLGWLEKGKVSRVDELSDLLQKFRQICVDQ